MKQQETLLMLRQVSSSLYEAMVDAVSFGVIEEHREIYLRLLSTLYHFNHLKIELKEKEYRHEHSTRKQH